MVTKLLPVLDQGLALVLIVSSYIEGYTDNSACLSNVRSAAKALKRNGPVTKHELQQLVEIPAVGQGRENF